MRQIVQDTFKSFSTKFEGYLPYMYADVKGLVTTGMGNLIDPIGAALSLPWKNSDGTLASQEQITDAWNAVKGRTDLKLKGGGAYKGVTTIRLDDTGINQLIQGKMKSNETILRNRFPAYDSWPADAQLALHSMAWALGPAFKYPKFQAAVNQTMPDFVTAATESHIGEAGNPGIIPRNKANFNLFMAAADVLSNNKDPDQLYGLVQAGTQAAQQAAQALAEKKTPVTQTMGTGAKIVVALTAIVGGAAGYDYYKKQKRSKK